MVRMTYLCCVSLLSLFALLTCADKLSYEGIWVEDWESSEMQFCVEGVALTGFYARGGSIVGLIADDGKLVKGTWKEQETGYYGNCSFLMNDDGTQWNGWFDDNYGNTGLWTGTRKSCKCSQTPHVKGDRPAICGDAAFFIPSLLLSVVLFVLGVAF